MPKYRNRKTGVTVEINAVMRGKNWEEVPLEKEADEDIEQLNDEETIETDQNDEEIVEDDLETVEEIVEETVTEKPAPKPAAKKPAATKKPAAKSAARPKAVGRK